jgi:hypothetical protein
MSIMKVAILCGLTIQFRSMAQIDLGLHVGGRAHPFVTLFEMHFWHGYLDVG